MPDDPLDDYLATLAAAARPQAPVVGPGDLMEAIAQAVNDAQWRDHQHQLVPSPAACLGVEPLGGLGIESRIPRSADA